MGVGPAALGLYLDLARDGLLRTGQSVIELGSQDFVPEQFDVSALHRQLDCPNVFSPRAGASSREWMESLGFGYACVDMDGRHGALKIDLNEPYDAYVPYDIVTNHGTTEHVFDQANAFKFVHHWTKLGGLMIHVLPMRGGIPGYGDHGLYLYTPGFFRDLASANGYEMLRLYPHEDNAGALICVAMRKERDVPFVKPIQGMYR